MLSLVFLIALQASTWTSIGSWSGQGIKETESFNATQREWRLTWTAKSIDSGLNMRSFGFSVYSAKDDRPVSTVSGGPTETSGESFVRGAGRFYLKITSVNAAWTIKAEERKQ